MTYFIEKPKTIQELDEQLEFSYATLGKPTNWKENRQRLIKLYNLKITHAKSDCGAGKDNAPGFQEGNTCAGDGGGKTESGTAPYSIGTETIGKLKGAGVFIHEGVESSIIEYEEMLKAVLDNPKPQRKQSSKTNENLREVTESYAENFYSKQASWLANIDGFDRDALHEYTTGDYGAMNRLLLMVKDGEVDESEMYDTATYRLQKMIEDAPEFDGSQKVYSGISPGKILDIVDDNYNRSNGLYDLFAKKLFKLAESSEQRYEDGTGFIDEDKFNSEAKELIRNAVIDKIKKRWSENRNSIISIDGLISTSSDIDVALHHSSPEDIKLGRGLNEASRMSRMYLRKLNKLLQKNGFDSVTSSFLNENMASIPKTILRINGLKKGVAVEPFANQAYPDEFEIIVGAGHNTWKLNSIEHNEDDDKIYVDVEEV